jgi:hypothetical protein
MTKNDYRLREAFLQTATIDHWDSPYSLTLTMKQAIRRGGRRIALDPLKASQNLKHFLNLLNAKLFSAGDARKGKRLRSIAVLEDGERYHYHLCLDKPAHVSAVQFVNLIHEFWLRTDFGYWMVDVQPCDAGWVLYMAKARSKTAYSDAFDWANFHNPL